MNNTTIIVIAAAAALGYWFWQRDRQLLGKMISHEYVTRGTTVDSEEEAKQVCTSLGCKAYSFNATTGEAKFSEFEHPKTVKHADYDTTKL